MTVPATKVLRSTVTNAYDFLDIEAGRVSAQDLFLGALNIDHVYDHVALRDLHPSVFWDLSSNATYPQPIDMRVLSHGVALLVGRIDSLEIHNFSVFSRSVGMLLTDSTDLSQNPPCGYGTGSDIDLDACVTASWSAPRIPQGTNSQTWT